MFVLPKVPSFGEKFAESLTQGLSKGSDLASQLIAEKATKGNIFEDINKLKSLKNREQSPLLNLSSEAQENTPSLSTSSESKEILGGLNEMEKASLASRYPETMRYLQKEELAKRKEDIREKEMGLKSTKEFRESVLRGYKGSKVNEAIYKKMEALNKGDLISPFMNKVSEKLGIPISILGNPESEEFDKLSNTLSREVSKVFRGRILQSEFENFLKQIPTLSNSKEGRNRIISTLRMLDKPNELEYQAYKKVMSENKGKIPWDLEERVLEKIEPELDKLADKIKSDTSSIPLSLDLMKKFIKMAAGNTKEEKIAHAKELARSQGYKIE